MGNVKKIGKLRETFGGTN